jgi:hypothetical protein
MILSFKTWKKLALKGCLLPLKLMVGSRLKSLQK